MKHSGMTETGVYWKRGENGYFFFAPFAVKSFFNRKVRKEIRKERKEKEKYPLIFYTPIFCDPFLPSLVFP